jgi:CDP-diacylglycerol pyrophosphatase
MNPIVRSVLILLAVSPSAYAADRDALRHIVQDQCLPHWRQQHDPAPCEQMVLPGLDLQRGYAVLADQKGGAHFLLIPTLSMSGIEDPALLRERTPDYFAAAWQARERLDAVVGHQLQRDAIGLAINSALARGQDQLHIHIECLRPAVYRALHTAAAYAIGSRWAPLAIEESPYRALRLMGQDLGDANPFLLLADDLHEAKQSIGDYTVIVAGMEFKEGPGFLVLAGRTPTRTELLLGTRRNGLVAPGETLLDARCAIDRGSAARRN